jgi:CTD small phosphatase-like protein 2
MAITLRRRASDGCLKLAEKTHSADLITQASRKLRKTSEVIQSGNPKRKRYEDVETSGQPADRMIGLETPLIKSSGKLMTLSTTTVSTDDSTGTSESLEERKREVMPTSSSITVTQTCQNHLKTHGSCSCESSEVCISHEVVSCSACTTMTTVNAHVSQDSPEEDVSDEVEFDPYAFIKALPPLRECVPARNSFLLPRQTRHSHKKTLVLDLDETLVHSTLDGSDQLCDFAFPVSLGSITHMVSVRKRPHLHTFLARMSRHFEVVVFTASQQIYAEQLLDIVDPKGEFIRHRIYRDSCVVWEGNYLKDLTVLGRDLAHTIIVDNSPQAFGFQPENGVPIKSWYDDGEDMELLRLLPFLEDLAHVDDVRPHLGRKYGLKDLVSAAPTYY